MERETGNGASPPYAWATDAVARERLDALAARVGRLEERIEERTSAHETRLDTIEEDRKDRKRRLDDLGGYAKAIRSIFVTAAAVSAAVLAWLNFARH